MRCLEDSREAKVSGHVSDSPALKQVESEVLSKREGAFDEERANGEEAEGLSEGWELVEKEEVLDAMASKRSSKRRLTLKLCFAFCA